MTCLEVVLSEQPTDEPRTFDDYVRARSVALQKYAFLVTRNTEDARDAVQDALIGLYPRWEQVSASGGVDAYVRRSVVNAAVSRWRKVRRLMPVAEPEDRDAAGSARRLDDAVTDAHVAWQLCDRLPPLQRAAVVLRFFDDLSFAEVGEALGCPEATSRSHVHRALARLRSELGEEDR